VTLMDQNCLLKLRFRGHMALESQFSDNCNGCSKIAVKFCNFRERQSPVFRHAAKWVSSVPQLAQKIGKVWNVQRAQLGFNAIRTLPQALG